MTVISEHQAYLMGFTFNIGEYTTIEYDQRMSTPELNDCISKYTETMKFYSFCDPKTLTGNRIQDFIRGFFDRNGKVDENNRTLYMPIDELPHYMKDNIDTVYDETHKWVGVNGLEFFAFMYYPECNSFLIDNQISFSRWCDSLTWGKTEIESFKWMKTREDAIAPVKNRFSDSGYDLTVLDKIKEVNGVCYYDTGIAVEPPHGYYFEVVGRSSISKTGWMLANNVGIIDASYRGSIIVALVRVNNDVDEIETPKRLVQLIPRRLNILTPVQVDNLTPTKRNNGGFGSSG